MPCAVISVCAPPVIESKANDIIVATRKKHNGMSWSKARSGALTVITAANVNRELDNWITTDQINFKRLPNALPFNRTGRIKAVLKSTCVLSIFLINTEEKPLSTNTLESVMKIISKTIVP